MNFINSYSFVEFGYSVTLLLLIVEFGYSLYVNVLKSHRDLASTDFTRSPMMYHKGMLMTLNCVSGCTPALRPRCAMLY